MRRQPALEKPELGHRTHLRQSLECRLPGTGDLTAVGGTRDVARAQSRVIVGWSHDGIEVCLADLFVDDRHRRRVRR